MRFSRLRLGFTLIELLVVVTLIGILTSIGILSYQSTNKRARDGRRQSDLEQVRIALEIYRSDNEAYPTTLAELVPTYMNSLLVDPKSPELHYAYSPAMDLHAYELCAHFELGDTSDYCGGLNNCGGRCNYRVTNP